MLPIGDLVEDSMSYNIYDKVCYSCNGTGVCDDTDMQQEDWL